MIIRLEQPKDANRIDAVITAAFSGVAHASGMEAVIVGALRDAGALAVSLIAEEGDDVVGHIAFSPVTIAGRADDWVALGPVAVRPDRQSHGIGRRLIEAGLTRLRAAQVAGCVLLGNPRLYGRFGFVADPALRYPGFPPAYFQRLVLAGPARSGEVAYHPAFAAA